MLSHRTLLFTAIILTITSIANADLILTLNGLDATKPLEIESKEDLNIAVAGNTKVDANACSVTAVGGVLKPITKSNTVSSKAQGGSYLFTFEDETGLGIISLIANEDMIIDGISVVAGGTIYELVLFYNPETDIVLAFGINLEALNFTPPQPKPEQQISVSQAALPATDGTGTFFTMGAGDCNDILDPNWYPNLNSDGIVNFVDFTMFANNWQQSGSGLDGDFDDSGIVDTNDMAILAYYWLASACGSLPEEVFDLFKTALLAGDVNEALTFVAKISRDKYAEIFQIIEPNLPDYAAGMGGLTFDRQRDGEVIYEMLHQDGGQTLLFPVFFIREEDGNWRIFNF